jgi:hypothetical protein
MLTHTDALTPAPAPPNSAAVAGAPTHCRCLLMLLCGHPAISTFLTGIDTVLVAYPQYNNTLTLLSLVFLLEYHSEPHEWCLFHTQSYQNNLFGTSLNHTSNNRSRHTYMHLHTGLLYKSTTQTPAQIPLCEPTSPTNHTTPERLGTSPLYPEP